MQLENEREGAPSCPHSQVDRRLIKSEYFKREFEAEVDECRNCGLKLWTADTHQRFHRWVLELKHEKRDAFQLQFYMPVAARQRLQEFLKRFPGVPMSVAIRAMTTVYLSSIVRFHEFQTISRRVSERHAYLLISVGVRKKTSIQFNPISLLDIHSWSDVLKLPPHKIVEEAIFKFLALREEEDPELRDFWERHLLPQLEIILRAM